jgi:membrane protein
MRDQHALSPAASKVVLGQISSLSQGKSGALGIGVVVAILIALWAVSGAMRSMMEAMNVMYEVEESRGIVKRYVVSIVLSLVIGLLFIFALGLVVAGPAIAGHLGEAGKWAWLILQWPVLMACVLLGLALLYFYAPAAEQRFKLITPGAAVAAVLWLIFSLAFSLYVGNFGSYNKTYGTLAGVIVVLLYFYYVSFILLIGAEMNRVIEQEAPAGRMQRVKRALGTGKR